MDNLGSLTSGLAKVFPQGRLGYAVFQRDRSSFSYKFLRDRCGSGRCQARRTAQRQVSGSKEVDAWVNAMEAVTSNTG